MKFKPASLFIFISFFFATIQAEEKNDLKNSTFKEIIDSVIDFRENYQHTEAIKLLIDAQKKLTKSQYLKYKPQILSHLIYLYDEKGEYSNAIIAGKELLKLNIKDSTLLSLAITNLGATYDNIGEKAIALDYYLKAQKIHLAIGQVQELHFNYNNIGNIYNYLDNYNQALINYLRAIAGAKKYRKDFLTNYYRGISRVYLAQRKFDLTKSYLDSALYMADQYDNKKEQSIVLDDFGDLFFERKVYDSALYFYRKSLDIKSSIDRKSSQLHTIRDISETHRKLTHYAKAIELGKSGFEESVRIKNNILIRDFSESLFDSYQAIGDYENAVKYHVLYKSYYDSLVNEEKSRDLLRTQIRFETEQKEAENQLLKQQDEISQQTIKAQNRFMIMLISGIIIFMIIAIVVYRAFLLNKRLAARIRIQKEEAVSSRDLIQKQSDKLKELDEAKSRFFANISHDLRSPLTLIMGSIEQVLTDKEVFLSNKAEKLLKTGYSNGDRIIHLTEEINELIQLEDGKLKLDAKETEIAKYLEVITGMFHSAAELKNIDLKFVNEIEKIKRPAIVKIDTKQFEKVMFNLISNAFKHTQSKDSIHIILKEKDEDNVSIVIKDSGEGIPAKNVSYIFDRYYQSPDTTYKTQEGFGIGLALVKEIVTKHEGEIWVTSELGAGSEFGVNLKKIKDVATEVEDSFSDMSYIAEKQKVFGALDNYVTKDRPLVNIDIDDNAEKSEEVILIVEDHPEVREYIKSIVEAKYKVLEAIDGQRALEVLNKEPVNLIITDLMMPFFDGFELLESLRNDEKLKTIPALVVSARTTDEDKRKVLSSGVNDFLSKPFNANELLQRIDNLLNQKDIWNNSNEDAIFINNKNQLDDAQQTLLKKVEALIIERIDDPNLSVMDLGNEMAASERQVYRMIKKLTDLTPFEYIKEVRWQYAQFILKNNKVNNPSEAARAIGMNNVSHFKTQYKKRFGKEPAELL